MLWAVGWSKSTWQGHREGWHHRGRRITLIPNRRTSVWSLWLWLCSWQPAGLMEPVSSSRHNTRARPGSNPTGQHTVKGPALEQSYLVNLLYHFSSHECLGFLICTLERIPLPTLELWWGLNGLIHTKSQQRCLARTLTWYHSYYLTSHRAGVRT